MDFTFGIITNGSNSDRIVKIVESIAFQYIPNYQIIVVGGNSYGKSLCSGNILWIPFDETTKPNWITRKKNIITENAKYNTIVYLHDYIYLLPGWYIGMTYIQPNWDICMTQILNVDDSRYRDWVIWADKDYINDPSYNGEPGVRSNIIDRVLPPYNYDKTKNMYISGAYFIAKKYVMQTCQLDETLTWGQSEDVKWSEEVLLKEKYRYVMNPYSKVKLMKYKDVAARVI